MASPEERNRLLEDERFREKLLYYTLGKVKDMGVAYLLMIATLAALKAVPENAAANIDNLEAYTFGILRNLIRKHDDKERASERIQVVEDKGVENITVSNLAGAIANRNLVDLIERMVKQEMPLIAQQVFALHFRKGYKIAEVARMLEKSEVYIRGIIYDIRQLAKRKFKYEY